MPVPHARASCPCPMPVPHARASCPRLMPVPHARASCPCRRAAACFHISTRAACKHHFGHGDCSEAATNEAADDDGGDVEGKTWHEEVECEQVKVKLHLGREERAHEESACRRALVASKVWWQPVHEKRRSQKSSIGTCVA